MKRLSIVSMVLVFFSMLFWQCSGGEDLVKGSIPPKEGGKIDDGTTAIIIFFKGTICGGADSLSLDGTDHISMQEIYGNTNQLLEGASVFDTANFPRLQHTTGGASNVLVLPLRGDTSFIVGRTYWLYIDNHHLACTHQNPEPEGCLHRDKRFEMKIIPSEVNEYTNPQGQWNTTVEPPYAIKTSPPDENLFTVPFPFPPHGDMQFVFSEPIPNLFDTSSYIPPFAESGDTPILGNSTVENYWLSILPSDLQALNGDSPSNQFNSATDTKLLLRTIEGWRPGITLDFMTVSTPHDIDDYIEECLDADTLCESPGLTNIFQNAAQDSSGAPLIAAGDSALVETASGSSIYWGVNQQPHGNTVELGNNEHDNINAKATLGRVRIDKPFSGKYFSSTRLGIKLTLFCDGIPSTDADVNSITLLLDGESIRNRAKDWMCFDVEYPYYIDLAPGFTVVQSFTVGQTYSIKTRAYSNDNKGGFDVINATAEIKRTPDVVILSPADGATIDEYSFQLTGTVEFSSTVGLKYVSLGWIGILNTEPIGQDTVSFDYYVDNPWWLDEGKNNNAVRVSAMDWMYITGGHSHALYVDTLPPEIYITSPLNGSSIIAPALEVSAYVLDSTSVYPITLNGVAPWSHVHDGNTTDYQFTLTSMEDGVTTLTVEAEDIFEHYGSEYIVVAYYNDADDDSMPDYWELQYGLTIQDPFSNEAPDNDYDGDGISNRDEYQLGTNPININADTDNDGMDDNEEIALGSNPAIPNNGDTTFYVDADEGDDDWSGHCPSLQTGTTCGPWQNLDMVSGNTFEAGDVIRFRKGRVWHESSPSAAVKCIILDHHGGDGEEGNPIIYTSYGDTGDPPTFDQRHYLDNYLSPAPVWSETVINGETVWATDVYEGSTTIYDLNWSLLMQNADGDTHSYSSNFQRLAKVGFCQVPYSDLVSNSRSGIETVADTPYSWCVEDLHLNGETGPIYQACDQGSAGCSRYEYACSTSGHGNKPPYDQTYYCHAHFRYYLNSPKNPNHYWIFIPYHGEINNSGTHWCNGTNGNKGKWLIYDGLRTRFASNGLYSWNDNIIVKNFIFDTCTYGVHLNSIVGNEIKNNTFLFIDMVSIDNFDTAELELLVKNNTIIGNSALDWNWEHWGEIAAVEQVYGTAGYEIIFQDNTFAYSRASLYIEEGKYLLEGNILTGMGYVFIPGDNNTGQFVQYQNWTNPWSSIAIVDREYSDTQISDDTLKRKNIIYKSGGGILNGYKGAVHMVNLNNTFYNVCFAMNNHGERDSTPLSYSSHFNNIGYNVADGVSCSNPWEYEATRASKSLSDYNFWLNEDGPEIAWQDTALVTGWPTNFYSLSQFKTSLESNGINDSGEKCYPGPNCHTLNDGHSKDTAGGPGLPRMYDSTICESSSTDPADSYPRDTWPETLADIQNGCMPDFMPESSTDPVVDAGAFIEDGSTAISDTPDVWALVNWLPFDDLISDFDDIFASISNFDPQIYDGLAPDMGAVEFDFQPPSPNAASGTRSGTITLAWDNYISDNQPDHPGYKLDLKYYVIQRTQGGNTATIKLDRMANGLVDYGATGNLHYTYDIWTEDYQGKKSCWKKTISCPSSGCQSATTGSTGSGGTCFPGESQP